MPKLVAEVEILRFTWPPKAVNETVKTQITKI